MTATVHILALNNADPTRTITLRRQFIADATRRYRNLAQAIRVSVVDRDALGLGRQLQGPAGLVAVPTLPLEFAFLRDAEKIPAFMAWLNEQERNSVLQIVPGPIGPEPWSNTHIRSSYQRGLGDSLIKLKQKGVDVPSPIIPGTGGVLGAFHQPFHQDRVQLAYTRTFTQLQGVTASMDGQISQILASGIMEGVGPEEMARRINDRVDKIGLTRSKLIARTEVVETYNQAAVAEFTRAEAAIGEEIFVEWFTAEDERVRSSHRARHGKIFTKEDGLRLIGEPNCLPGDAMIRSSGNLERVYKRFYDGLLVVIRTAAGNELAVTPNHPVFTPSGFVAALELQIGMNVMCRSGSEITIPVGHGKNNVEAPFHEVERAFSLTANMSLSPSVGMHFHGDGTDGDIAVVWTDSKLRNNVKAKALQHFNDMLLKWGIMKDELLAGIGSFDFALNPVLVSASGDIGLNGLRLALGVGHGRAFEKFGFGLGTGGAPEFKQDGIDAFAPETRGLVDRVGGHPTIEHSHYPGMKEDRIIGVNYRHFSGHVYNLQSSIGSYIAQNIINGNCRCALLPIIESVDGEVELASASTFKRAA